MYERPPKGGLRLSINPETVKVKIRDDAIRSEYRIMRIVPLQHNQAGKGVLRKDFDLLRNSHSTVPMYADE